MLEITPKIEPLFEDLKKLELGEFLLSQDFKRYCIKINFEESWRNAFKYAQDERGYLCVGMNHDLFDSIEDLGLILNRLYQSDRGNFFGFVHDLLLIYTQWSKKDLWVKDVLDDLALLSAPENIVSGIEKLGNYFSTPVPKTSIPEKIGNSEKPESFLRKMDDSIKKEEYNTTLTYAYSCLEGLYCFCLSYEKRHIKCLFPPLGAVARFAAVTVKIVCARNKGIGGGRISGGYGRRAPIRLAELDSCPISCTFAPKETKTGCASAEGAGK